MSAWYNDVGTIESYHSKAGNIALLITPSTCGSNYLSICPVLSYPQWSTAQNLNPVFALSFLLMQGVSRNLNPVFALSFLKHGVSCKI